MNNEEILNYLKTTQYVKIDLGCGLNKRDGYLGVDSLPLPGVDYVLDLNEGLTFLPDNSVDEIISSHFLEHIQNLEFLMREIYRVLKPNGKKIIYVPHFSNPYYYSDYTHVRFFGFYSFDYFSKGNSGYKRGVPQFYQDFQFKVIERRLIFKSPFWGRSIIKQFYNRFFNASKYLQEYYEENLTWIIPCQEIKFVICKDKNTV